MSWKRRVWKRKEKWWRRKGERKKERGEKQKETLLKEKGSPWEGQLLKAVLWLPYTCAPVYTSWNTQHMYKHTCTHDTHGLSGYMLTTAALFRCCMSSKHVYVVTTSTSPAHPFFMIRIQRQRRISSAQSYTASISKRLLSSQPRYSPLQIG